MENQEFIYSEKEIKKIEERNKTKKSYENLAFLHSPWARTIRMLSEYQYPLSIFVTENVSGTVVFFGSARIKPASELKSPIDHAPKFGDLSRFYDDARELSRRLTLWFRESKNQHQKYLICSGGGPGIMEAANRGAMDAGGESIGLNISLPFEQKPNPYITKKFSIEFHYFFLRKYWFVSLAQAIVVFPGGFGTLDEFLETLTLIQTQKHPYRIPIVVYGSDFWKKIVNFDALVEYGVISPEDLDLFHFIDNLDEAFHFITKSISAYPLEPEEREHMIEGQ